MSPISGLSNTALFDPLLASTVLPYISDIFPLGFPVRIETNAEEVLRTAALSWGSSKQRFSVPPTEFRVLVSDDIPSAPVPPPTYRAQRHLMVAVSDADHFGVCQLAGGFGFACTTMASLCNDDFFRYHFLEGLIYSLLDTRHLATIHSACVSWRGYGVLLVGESGAGKSSFAYACTRRGWTYTADDAVSLLLEDPGRTVIGNPNGFRFRPSISTLFPELQGLVRDRNGKPTLEIRTEQLPHIIPCPETSVNLIVFLRREQHISHRTSATPVQQPESFRRLYQPPWPSGLPTNEARRQAVARLSEASAYQLTYSDLDEAIDTLEKLLISRLFSSP